MTLGEKVESCIYDIVIIDNATNRLILKGNADFDFCAILSDEFLNSEIVSDQLDCGFLWLTINTIE